MSDTKPLYTIIVTGECTYSLGATQLQECQVQLAGKLMDVQQIAERQLWPHVSVIGYVHDKREVKGLVIQSIREIRDVVSIL
jgi:hypothetical protein